MFMVGAGEGTLHTIDRAGRKMTIARYQSKDSCTNASEPV